MLSAKKLGSTYNYIIINYLDGDNNKGARHFGS